MTQSSHLKMGWSYSDEIAYGVHVKSWDNPGIKELIEEHRQFLNYSRDMSLQGPGTLFVYVRSTYEELDRDNGAYANRGPDTEGTNFKPPRHRYFHDELTKDEPILTIEEVKALNAIQAVSKSRNNAKMWVHHAQVYY